MIPSFVLELAIILALIGANGVFAMSEIAVVSARRARLQHRAHEGDRRAKMALQLAENPSDFLSTVQVGITLVGVLTGAFGGATLAEDLATYLAKVPAFAAHSQMLAFVVVVVGISYLSLILGELVPKRLGLNNPEETATRVAIPMRVLSLAGSPIVRVLSLSTDFVVWLLRVPPSTEPSVTEDEVKFLLRQGALAGTFEESERLMIESVLKLADWRVGAVMTPRADIEWLDPSDPRDEVARVIAGAGHSHFPVADGSLDALLGVAHTRDLLLACLSGQPADIRAMAKEPLYVPESMRVLRLVERFRRSHSSVAFVIDEYGTLEGLVTLADVLDAIVRDLPTADGQQDDLAVRRKDGSWLLDGGLPVDRFKELLNLRELPQEDEGIYQTLGGLVMLQLGHIPSVGESFDWQGVHIEVVDMDGRRVDKVLAATVQQTSEKEKE